jgi:multiple sugar transport system substrate-binding protein
MAVVLRGLAWDHRRCWGPLDASLASYCRAHPDVTVQWDRRSLYDFGEGRIEDAVRNYDLVIYDHPFVGDVARQRLMLGLEKRHFETDSVGKSWQSYEAEGDHWALPIDAAAQVSSYRPDLLSHFTDQLPKTHAEVLALGRRLNAEGKWLGLPWVPTDAMCLLLSFAAGANDPLGADGRFLPVAAVERIVGQLREMVSLAHPLSKGWNPIRCYDHMVSNDDVVYVPFAFGYVNYAARLESPHLRFGNIPVPGAKGALLGGAGIGVSAFSAHHQAAVDYALYLCSPEYQSGDYVKFGGQPGSLKAWTDAGVNAGTRNFFSDTLATLTNSYLRSTEPGFISFFRDCTHHAARAMAGELSAKDFAECLNKRYALIDPAGSAQRGAT